MENRYVLNPAHANDTIITRAESGQEVIVTKDTFNDYFAERMIACGQDHLVMVNPHYTESMKSEKKSFVQISENVISSTLIKDLTDENQQSETAKGLELKRRPGRQPKPKDQGKAS